MKSLFVYYLDLCLLRSTPQQLPKSSLLLGLVFIANLVMGLFFYGDLRDDFWAACAQSLVSSGFTLLFVYILLAMNKTTYRFVQVASALLGALLILDGLAFLLIPSSLVEGGAEVGEFSLTLLLLLMLWSIVVAGHVFRHAFDVSFFNGFGLGVIYTLFGVTVMSWIF